LALVTLLTAGSTSAAFACCGAPVVYAPAPVVYAAPVPVAVPVPTPIAVPVMAGCGCSSRGLYAAPTPVAAAPIYVVNQGPDYSGPGVMVPYRTYSPAAAWAPATGYPYVHAHGYAHHYFYHRHGYGPRYGYYPRGNLRPVHWRHYPSSRLDVRG
jgi:hypothetical protein